MSLRVSVPQRTKQSPKKQSFIVLPLKICIERANLCKTFHHGDTRVPPGTDRQDSVRTVQAESTEFYLVVLGGLCVSVVQSFWLRLEAAL